MLMFIIYGLIIGLIAKAIHPGEEPVGCLPTLAIGIGGSFLGGYLNYILRLNNSFHLAGPIMSVVGAVICCYIWTWYSKK